jgi:hypothetical protein
MRSNQVDIWYGDRPSAKLTTDSDVIFMDIDLSFIALSMETHVAGLTCMRQCGALESELV